MNYKFESKKELREYMRGRTIREVMVGGVMPGEAREIQIRFVGGEVVTFTATSYRTIEVTA